jgi:hypothetical protein
MRYPSIFCLTVALSLSACVDKSGSPPEFFPEVRFLVEPLGGQQGTNFAVEYLASASARHELQPGRTFTATEPVGFFLENAAPPYAASFTWIDGAEADVALIIAGETIQISPVRLGPDNVGSLEIFGGGGGRDELAIDPGDPEIRLEVFADPGTLFQGTIGDFFISYDVGLSSDDDERLQPRAPAIIFFEDARETVSAVFRNANDLDITIQLFVDGELKESDTSQKDAIVKRNL